MNTSVSDLNTSTNSKVKGAAAILIQSRKDPNHSGTFNINVSVKFDSAVDDYPTGTIKINVDLSDSAKAKVTSTFIEQINSFGKHNPTTILTGRCKVALQEGTNETLGCKYWIIIADNKSEDQNGTPDIVGFVVIDRSGNRIAYGIGPVIKGNFDCEPH